MHPVVVQEPGPLYDSRMFRLRRGSKDVAWSSGAVPVPPEEGHSAVMTDRLIKMLDNALDTGAPFFMYAAYDDPHPSYFVTPPYDTLVDPMSVPLPPRGEGRRAARRTEGGGREGEGGGAQGEEGRGRRGRWEGRGLRGRGVIRGAEKH